MLVVEIQGRMSSVQVGYSPVVTGGNCRGELPKRMIVRGERMEMIVGCMECEGIPCLRH